MSAAVGASKVLNITADVHQFIEIVKEVNDPSQEIGVLKVTSFLNRLTNLGFTFAEMGMSIAGEDPEKIKKLKTLELAPRVSNLVLEAIRELENSDISKPGGTKCIERGLVAPILDILRVRIEMELLAGPNAGDRSLELLLVFLSTARMTAQLEVISTLHYFFAGQKTPPSSGVKEIFSLLNLDHIPIPLQNDNVFRQYRCRLTNQPVRDPVRDPTVQERVIYERSAIRLRLENNPNSPVSGRPLRVENLREMPNVKKIIDDKLREHERNLMQYLKDSPNLRRNLWDNIGNNPKLMEILRLPPNPELFAAATQD